VDTAKSTPVVNKTIEVLTATSKRSRPQATVGPEEVMSAEKSVLFRVATSGNQKYSVKASTAQESTIRRTKSASLVLHSNASTNIL
jgi:hypothetical protein